jgi:Fe-S-cluster-containing dehydrogenase component
MKCVSACPFGAIYAHADVDYPIKCDLCGGDPKCVHVCPKNAIRMIPEQLLGESKRMKNLVEELVAIVSGDKGESMEDDDIWSDKRHAQENFYKETGASPINSP